MMGLHSKTPSERAGRREGGREEKETKRKTETERELGEGTGRGRLPHTFTLWKL